VSHLSLDLYRGSPMTALGIELISCITHLTLKAASDWNVVFFDPHQETESWQTTAVNRRKMRA
jgi:hypothetical protein